MGSTCNKCKKYYKKIFFEQKKKNIILYGYDVLESTENSSNENNSNNSIINLFNNQNNYKNKEENNENVKIIVDKAKDKKDEQYLGLNEEEKLIEKKDEGLIEIKDNIIEIKEDKYEKKEKQDVIEEKEEKDIIEVKEKEEILIEEKKEELDDKEAKNVNEIKNEKKEIINEKENNKEKEEEIQDNKETRKEEEGEKEINRDKENEKQEIEGKKEEMEEKLIDNKENIEDKEEGKDEQNIEEEKKEGKDEQNIEEKKEKEEIKPQKKEKGETKKMAYEILLKDYLDDKINDTNVFDKNWYSDIEKNKIIYSKRSIIALIKEAFDDKNNEFEEIHNEESLQISVKSKGSMITDQFQVVRSLYKINKDIYPPKSTIRMIFKYLNFIKERSSWDSQLKLYKILEGTEEGKEVKCIVHNWLKSPMFFVSERDIIDKRYEFYYNGKIYSFESSVNDELYPPEKSVTRMYDYMSIEELYEEDNYIYLKAITQIDSKVSLPQSVVNSTLPSKLSNFYKNLANAMNNDYKDGKLIFEDWLN